MHVKCWSVLGCSIGVLACSQTADQHDAQGLGLDSSKSLAVQILLHDVTTCPIIGKADQEHTFQVIGAEDAFSAALNAIPNVNDCEVPLSFNGEEWHPSIDFSKDSVVWVTLGYEGIVHDSIEDISAWCEGDTVRVDVTIEPAPCSGDDSISYPFAFAKFPRQAVSHYLFQEHYGARPDCDAGAN